MSFLGNAYPWVKAAHVIFVIFFMAAIFMMPRFFIYHQQTAVGSAEDQQWIEREDRLRRIILNPSILFVWVFGLMLMVETRAWEQHWFQLKFLIALLLGAYHGWMISYARRLAAGRRDWTDKQLRLMNEVPGMSAALIVVLVIVRPF